MKQDKGYWKFNRQWQLDLNLTNSESQVAMTEFLHGMIRRGLRPPLTMTSDAASGLVGALQATWPRALRVRCWFHKMQNLKQKAPLDQCTVLRTLILDMRDAPELETDHRRLDQIVRNYQVPFPELCCCLTDDWEASLNHLQASHRQPSGAQICRTTPPHQGYLESMAGETTDQTSVRRADPAQ